jgi:hypothetical protein
MFFQRLPPDKYPDDFDTPLYARYSPRLKPGLWLWMRDHVSRFLLGMTLFGAIGIGFLGALIILPPAEPQIVIVTSVPTATPVGDIQGDFPAGIMQQSITLPARIDNALGSGEKHGYRFFTNTGITWVITVYPDSQFDPVLTLYHPDGTALDLNDDISESDLTSQLIFTPQTAGQYGIVIEGAGGISAGGYTLMILPQ